LTFEHASMAVRAFKPACRLHGGHGDVTHHGSPPRSTYAMTTGSILSVGWMCALFGALRKRVAQRAAVAPLRMRRTDRRRTPASQDDLVSVITKDHREVEWIFAQLESGQGSPQHRRDLADHLTTELVRHSEAEEIYMYPPARKSFPGGDQVADHEIAEHAEVERTLKDLESVDATDSTVDDLVGKLIADIRHHVQDEEQQLLPRL
jgi:hemerythrin superfamily protein